MAALVGGTDDEHPHVLLSGCIQRRGVVLADVIPMDVHVVERSAVAAGDNHIRRPMGGEPHMTDASIDLPSTDHVHAAPGTQGLLQMLRQVDAVNGQQIQALTAEPLEAEGQLILKGIRVLPRWHLALQDPRRVRRCCDGPPQLPLRAAVVTGCLDVMKTKVRGALQRGLQVGLGIRRDLVCRQVSPALLKTHPTERQHRNGQLRATETAGEQVGHQPLGRGCRSWRIRSLRSVSSSSKGTQWMQSTGQVSMAS